MAINTITLEFELCELTPANGYKILYRPVGSEEDYRTWPNVTESPAVIVDENDDPEGTQYEGFIQGDCGGGKLGVPVPWFTGMVTSEPDDDVPLLLRWDDIGNAPVGDVNDVSQWNIFMGLAFNSVLVSGNDVRLYRSATYTLPALLFQNNGNITQIVDEGDIMIGVGANACEGASNLETFTANACLTLGNAAFIGCVLLANVNLASLTTIGSYSFADCDSYLNPNHPLVTTLGSNAFLDSGVITADFPLITNIPVGCFQGCADFTGGNFPLVTSLGVQAFGGCTSYANPSFPLVTTVGDNAFSTCTSLATLDLSSCTNLGSTGGNDLVFAAISGNAITLTILAATAGDGDVTALMGSNSLTVIPV